MPRHAAGVIQILPRHQAIAIETDALTSANDTLDQLHDELEALAFSTELL